ncbi:hypothetical protein CMEL01_15809 [Colletotrichum melonis]|uniref:Uncharacterized protein n=1 Tax=Colletotrichum melonis TaxID=1209925 RepID=A0AAI9UG72_9PEZI|nr:hypothetical protein CMEL01_15809 [Colletotrichum melonis]
MGVSTGSSSNTQADTGIKDLSLALAIFYT